MNSAEDDKTIVRRKDSLTAPQDIDEALTTEPYQYFNNKMDSRQEDNFKRFEDFSSLP